MMSIVRVVIVSIRMCNVSDNLIMCVMLLMMKDYMTVETTTITNGMAVMNQKQCLCSNAQEP